MAFYLDDNPMMDISKIISANLTAWMGSTNDLDTVDKVTAKSGVGFGTVRRCKNGDANITVEKLTLIAQAFKRHPAALLVAPDDYASAPETEPPKACEPEANRYAVFSPPVAEVIEIMESLTHAQQRDVAAAVKMFLITCSKDEKNST